MKRKQFAEIEGEDGKQKENEKIVKKRNPGVEWRNLRTRTSPLQFYETINDELGEKQKEVVRRMGFGKLLDFKVAEIPAQLGYYVVNNLDTEKMEIVVGSSRIKVDAEILHRLFGLSTEGIDLLSIPKLKNLSANVANWRARYKSEYITPSDISTRITTSNDDDSVLFEIDFLMLFLSTMVDIDMSGKCKLGILQNITDDLDFKDVNWAKYVLDKTKVCKAGWDPLNNKSYFCGPTTMLVIIYVESISCLGLDRDKTENPITYWTKRKLKMRQDMEIKNGGFGLGKLRLEIGETSTAIIEQTPKEERLSKVTKWLDLWIKDKKEIEEHLKEIYNMDMDDQEVIETLIEYEHVLEDLPNWQEEKHECHKALIQVANTVPSVVNTLGDRRVETSNVHEAGTYTDAIVIREEEINRDITNQEDEI